MIWRAVIWGALTASSAASGIEPRAFESVLKLLGYQTTHARRLSPGMVVIPSSEHLTPSQAAKIREFIRSGGDAIIAGPDALSTVLGIGSQEAVAVKDVTELAHPERYLRWNPTAMVPQLTAPEGTTILMQDQVTHRPLAFYGKFGQGRYLALAAAFDESSEFGTSRYPYFAEYLRRAFDYRPLLTSPRLEAYFDPAYRVGADLRSLARSWHDAGIRAIYAATWYDFDYARLIAECHSNGIAVYAWFTLPMITPAFWDQHPEWRDTRTGWRYPMNMQIPEARQAALDFVSRTVEAYSWDGVNLAEIDAGTTEQVVALHRDLLQMFASKHVAVIVTALDSPVATQIAALNREFPFTLQFEDHFQYWMQPPNRYQRFDQSHHPMWDINIVADRDVEATNLPSALATGTEFLQTLRSAGSVNDRVAVYAESTVAPQDWEFAAAALAADAIVTQERGGIRIRSSHVIQVTDGPLLPPGDHRVLIPSKGR